MTPDELARGDFPDGGPRRGCLDTLFGMVWVMWCAVIGMIFAVWLAGGVG